MRTGFLVRSLVAIGALAVLVHQPAHAQDVQYRSVTRLDMGTALNIAMKMAGASEVSQTTYIKGKKMRTDADKSSTIYDLDQNRFIIINHDDKTYISVPITEMTAAFTEMTRTTTRTEAGQMKATARDSAGNKADFTFRVKMDPTGERESIAGHDAQRIFASLETDVSVTPEGQATAQDAGTLAVLVDTWNANSGPASDAMRGFQQAMSKQLREQMASRGAGSSAAMSYNPQLAQAMQKATVEQQKMDGVPMRSTLHFIVVPPGMKLDRDAAIKPQESGAGDVAKRALGGMLGGLRRQQQQEKPAATVPKQSTMMKVMTEIRDVQTASLSASLFQAPAGYRAVPLSSGAGK